MKPFHRQKLFSAVAKGLFVLLALLALPFNAPAQPNSPQRWLFVFDLSSTMKKRLPATEAVLKNFFASAAEGRLQDGDNIGVWTYDQKTHGGQFPLAVWNQATATTLPTNLIAFLQSRTYPASSQLSALQPALNGVITNSERLTIVIFCDGESDITATPYDAGINQSFLDGQAERKKNSQPFVVLIRTLSGKYIGCTVNFPPGAINIPLFLQPAPPTNVPPPPPPPVAVVAAKPPPVVVPDLVIVGTHVTTNSATEVSSPAPNTAVSLPPPTKVAPAVNNPPAATVISPASKPVASVPPAKVVTPTAPSPNPVAVANVSNKASGGANHRLWVVVSLAAADVVLGLIWFIRSNRRSESSLITSSMQNDPRRK